MPNILTYNVKGESMITIGDLKKLIQGVSDEVEIGVEDHYGDFIEMSTYDFALKSNNQNGTKFIIDPPNIGEAPD